MTIFGVFHATQLFLKRSSSASITCYSERAFGLYPSLVNGIPFTFLESIRLR
jgi:hypothetical protein